MDVIEDIAKDEELAYNGEETFREYGNKWLDRIISDYLNK